MCKASVLAIIDRTKGVGDSLLDYSNSRIDVPFVLSGLTMYFRDHRIGLIPLSAIVFLNGSRGIEIIGQKD